MIQALHGKHIWSQGKASGLIRDDSPELRGKSGSWGATPSLPPTSREAQAQEAGGRLLSDQ